MTDGRGTGPILRRGRLLREGEITAGLQVFGPPLSDPGHKAYLPFSFGRHKEAVERAGRALAIEPTT
jgi:hypothetical protein